MVGRTAFGDVLLTIIESEGNTARGQIVGTGRVEGLHMKMVTIVEEVGEL